MGNIGGGGSESKPKDLTPGEYKKLRSEVAEQLGFLIPELSGLTASQPTLGAGLNPYDYVEPISGGEQSIIDRISSEALGGTAGTNAAADYNAALIRGEYLEPDPATREAIIAPIRREFEETRLGDVGAFTAAGQNIQQSSPFFRARSLAQEGYANAIANVEAQLREAGRGRQFTAAQNAEAIDATRVQNALARLEAVALPRLVRDLGIERGIQAFNTRVETLLAMLQGILGATTTVATGQKAFSLQGQTI